MTREVTFANPGGCRDLRNMKLSVARSLLHAAGSTEIESAIARNRPVNLQLEYLESERFGTKILAPVPFQAET